MKVEEIRVKQASAPVSAGSEKMRVIQTVVVALARYAAILQRRVAHIAKAAMYAPPADVPKVKPDAKPKHPKREAPEQG